MYANLRVTPHTGATVRPDAIGKRELDRMQRDNAGMDNSMYAYEVKVGPDGAVHVELDINVDGNYAEHGGHVRIEGGCTIQADF